MQLKRQGNQYIFIICQIIVLLPVISRNITGVKKNHEEILERPGIHETPAILVPIN